MIYDEVAAILETAYKNKVKIYFIWSFSVNVSVVEVSVICMFC